MLMTVTEMAVQRKKESSEGLGNRSASERGRKGAP